MTEPKNETPTTDQNEPLAAGEGETNDPTDASETATYTAPEGETGAAEGEAAEGEAAE